MVHLIQVVVVEHKPTLQEAAALVKETVAVVL
jgi:hypothetical protein